MLKKIIGWVVPSISEFEFIFFVSIFMSSIIAVGSLHLDLVYRFMSQLLFQSDLSSSMIMLLQVTIVVLVLMSFVWSAIKMARSPVPDPLRKGLYGITIMPTYMMALLAMSQVLSAHGQALQGFQLVVNVVVLIRGLILMMLVKFSDVDGIRDIIGEEFSPVQARGREVLLIVVGGLALGVNTLRYDNWIGAFITSYLVGSTVIRLYRQRWVGTRLSAAV